MKQTWRWFGPSDAISISEIRQTGASGVVTALHHVPPGQAWSVAEIKLRQQQVMYPDGMASGLNWDVVESVPVSEAIKRQTGPVRHHIEAYKETLVNLAICGIHTVCYNFMPVLDWTRTDLGYPLANGGQAMRFDLVDFALFDCFILNRSGAEDDYAAEIRGRAQNRYAKMHPAECEKLSNNIVAGLPGANDNWSIENVRYLLESYAGITPETLRTHLIDFLSEIVPTAEKLGMRLCCHPDDPPFSLLGLPRVMSSLDDYTYVLNAVDSPANGVTFCTGSLGVSDAFDPVEFIRTLGHKIHFAHLRNIVRNEPSDVNRSSFDEAEHLAGDVDIVSTIRALLEQERHRKDEGRPDHEIPMRPDHGHALLSDHDRPVQPGYPLIGRLRGLGELRGVIAALSESQKTAS